MRPAFSPWLVAVPLRAAPGRDRTMLPRRLFSLMMRICSFSPMSLSRLRTWPQVDLRSGQKRLEADVNRQAALDARNHHALNDLVPVIALADLVPNLDAVRLFLGEDNLAFAVLFFFQKNVHFFANLKLASMIGEFIQINRPFGLVAHIYQHGVPPDMHHAPADNLAFLDVLETFFIELFQFFAAADRPQQRQHQQRLHHWSLAQTPDPASPAPSPLLLPALWPQLAPVCQSWNSSLLINYGWQR